MGGIVKGIVSPITSILGMAGGADKPVAPPTPAPELPGGLTAGRTAAGQRRRNATSMQQQQQSILTEAPDEKLGG